MLSSSLYPSIHAQSNPPALFIHLISQSWFPLVHSSISDEKNTHGNIVDLDTIGKIENLVPLKLHVYILGPIRVQYCALCAVLIEKYAALNVKY